MKDSGKGVSNEEIIICKSQKTADNLVNILFSKFNKFYKSTRMEKFCNRDRDFPRSEYK